MNNHTDVTGAKDLGTRYIAMMYLIIDSIVINTSESI